MDIIVSFMLTLKQAFSEQLKQLPFLSIPTRSFFMCSMSHELVTEEARRGHQMVVSCLVSGVGTELGSLQELAVL